MLHALSQYEKLHVDMYEGRAFATWKVGKVHHQSNYQCFRLKMTLLNGPLEGQMIPAQRTNQWGLLYNIQYAPIVY